MLVHVKTWSGEKDVERRSFGFLPGARGPKQIGGGRARKECTGNVRTVKGCRRVVPGGYYHYAQKISKEFKNAQNVSGM